MFPPQHQAVSLDGQELGVIPARGNRGRCSRSVRTHSITLCQPYHRRGRYSWKNALLALLGIPAQESYPKGRMPYAILVQRKNGSGRSGQTASAPLISLVWFRAPPANAQCVGLRRKHSLAGRCFVSAS